MNSPFRCFGLLIAVAMSCLALTTPGVAAQKVAVFPFDIRDIGQEHEIVPQYNPEDLRRLKVVAKELTSLFEKDSRYEVVDMSAFAEEIEEKHPFSRCNGCEVDIAKKAGAELSFYGHVEKLNDALLSLQIFGRDVKTGEIVKSMSAEIRGNTDELWLHGVNYLWRNRFKEEAAK